MPRLFQSPADKPDIIAGPAAASGLGDQDSRFIQVILSGQEGVHDLAHHDQGWVAGVVVDELQPHIHSLAVIRVEYLQTIAHRVKGGLQKPEVNRGHLRAEDGIVLAHLLGKDHPVHTGRNNGTLHLPLFPDADGREQRADADAGRPQVVYLVDF